MKTTITVEQVIHAPVEKVWEMWITPSHIVQWCHASDDWEAPDAKNDARVDGTFSTTMAAKDGSTSFDFAGVYTKVKEFVLIEYDLNDGRHVIVQFSKHPNGTKITETFEIEQIRPPPAQKSGWQAILNNFKKHVETTIKQQKNN